jgi:hypothetical protein
MPEGVEARSGEAPVGGVKISDILASKDGVDGVGIKLFKARANLPQREIRMFFSML